MQRWTEYAVRDTDDGEIEGGPFESRRSAENWISDPSNTKFCGPCEIVEREMTAGNWTSSAVPAGP